MPARFLTLRTHKTRRALAMLSAFCCFWLSTFGSLFHTDCALSAAPTQRSLARGSVASVKTSHVTVNSTSSPSIHAAAVNHHPPHCLACEWQANSVSVALPTYAVTPTPQTVQRVVTTLPRYLPSLAFPTPSRAPPAV